MQTREMVLNKIDAQEKEWVSQIKYLQSMIINVDSRRRVELEKCINHLQMKLMIIEKQTSELRKANSYIWDKHGDNIAEIWDELVHNVDYVISSYKRIFGQYTL